MTNQRRASTRHAGQRETIKPSALARPIPCPCPARTAAMHCRSHSLLLGQGRAHLWRNMPLKGRKFTIPSCNNALVLNGVLLSLPATRQQNESLRLLRHPGLAEGFTRKTYCITLHLGAVAAHQAGANTAYPILAGDKPGLCQHMAYRGIAKQSNLQPWSVQFHARTLFHPLGLLASSPAVQLAPQQRIVAVVVF